MSKSFGAAQYIERCSLAAPRIGVWFFRDMKLAAAERYVFMSLREIAQRSARLQSALQQLGLERGERVAFMVPALPWALPLLLATLDEGLVAIPMRPPLTAAERDGYAPRAANALAGCAARVLVVPSAQLALFAQPPSDVRILALEDLTAHTDDARQPRRIAPSDPALIRIDLASAGSAPLTLCHADLLEHLSELRTALAPTETDVFATWLPPFDDAGLSALLLPLFCQCSSVVLPTQQFLRQPSSWLQAISDKRATITFAPEQGYAHCTKRIAPAEQVGLDLTSWRIAGAVGARIPAGTAQAFARAFASTGFAASAFSAYSGNLPAPAPIVRAPLSVGQHALWYLDKLHPDSRAYNVPLCFRITSALDVGAMQRALEAVVARHPALCSVFPEHAGKPYRRARTGRPLPLEFSDVRALDAASFESQLLAAVEQRFDLAQGPLFVAKLFQRGENDAVLLLVAHHINVDGSSILQIGTELSLCYAALASGASVPPLPASEQTYDAFVDWQARLLAGREGARLRAYWAEKLAGAPAGITLRTDHARPRARSERGASVPVLLSEATTQALRSLAQAQDTTLFTTVLAAFTAWLEREFGDRELVVATPALGRASGAFAGVVGYFVNTLPLRARVAPDAAFDTLVHQLRSTVLEALDHQDLPYPLIVEQARVTRDPSRLPLCQVMFQLQTFRPDEPIEALVRAFPSGGQAECAGLTTEGVELARRIAQFELMIDLNDFGASVSGSLHYSTDLFEPASARKFAQAFQDFTSWLAEHSSTALAGWHVAGQPNDTRALLEPAELALLEHWNDTALHYPDGRVHTAFEQQASQHPDACALTFDGNRLSYAALNARANRVAHHLRKCGVGRDVLVGVAMERSLELPLVLLAVMKAGGAYVPLDPTFPDTRLQFMLSDADPKVVIADAAVVARLGASSSTLITTEDASTIASCEDISDANLEDASAPGDLAYVIYTSGSTGQPKGAANTHAGLWNRLYWMQQRYAIGRDDCVLHKTPYSFDVSVWELFLPLMSGARLSVARPNGHKDSRYLRDAIERSGVTTVHFVPSMLEAFLEETARRPARLLRVICSGEALPYDLMQRCFVRLPGVELHNLYGPTEASIDVTAWACAPNPEERVWIGRPIANTQIYILDEQLRRVPIGQVGELYIGGAGLARGYHQRPELTAERFISNPFAAVGGERLYKTGDLARFRADGQIEYLGRNDDQVKIRGLRVELGEIEAVASKLLAGARCVVAPRLLPSGASRLEAFVVHPGGDLSALEAGLRTRLPEYMVPSIIEAVAEIPLTHSGKADRRKLLEAAAERRARSDAPEPVRLPKNEREQILLEVWQEVLGREVTIQDNYFAVGGDSIRSLQVRAAARARGLEVDLQAILVHQTIATLAQSLSDQAAPSPEVHIAPFGLLNPADRARAERECEDAFPATQLQLGMLYHSELSQDSWAYHDTLSFELGFGASFRALVLRQALHAVMQRHPALRSAFDLATYSEPLQLVQRAAEPPLSVRDLRACDPEAARAIVREYLATDRATHYRLETAPLFRLMAHVLDERRVRLTLSFHHAILDGWSAASLLREIFSDYLRLTGESWLPVVGPPTHSPAEFVALERAALASEATREYWRDLLDGSELAPVARWPAALRATTSGSKRQILELEPTLSAQLAAKAAELNVSHKTLLLAAHLRCLAAFSGATEVITGRVVHGRPELADAERVLGLFLNTLPLRVELAGRSWAELADLIGRHEQQAHPHRRLPMREIARLTGQKVLFETGFNYVHFHLYDALVASDKLRVLDPEVHENTTFTLMANFVRNPSDDRLALHLEYDVQQIAPAQAQQIAHAYVLALEALLCDVNARVLDSVVVGPEEQARIERFSRGGNAHDAALVHELFERQAERTPHAIAVELGDRTLSYRELDGRANATAKRLLSAGAKARGVVAICAGPSLERAVCVLAALKAGQAYLPIDPSFPVARLQGMLEDARASYALATPEHADAAFLSGLQVLEVGVQGACEERPDCEVTPDDPAYVIFTSGSTGRPKGIVMHHAPVSNLVRWQNARSALPLGAATTQASAFSFDVSFQEMFSTWTSGGRLVMVPEHCRRDARELARLLLGANVARLFAPVVVLHQLAEVAEQLEVSLPELQEVNTAGEQLEITPAVRAFFRQHPRCRLDNQYGPTETHVATALRLEGQPDAWPLYPAIGAPLPGVVAHVLDAQQRPAPLGVSGELYLAGACVATGYIHQPLLSAERFLADPRQPGGRMYRTGDLARYLPDGTLEYLGRCDAQVKIRGYRVELSEIEAAILQAGEGRVQRAAVIAVAGRSRAIKHELAAYVVWDGARASDLERLQAALARTLPVHMLPSTFTLLPSMPLTPSGKLDRRALPLPLPAAAAPRVHVAPATALESALVELWQEVLVAPELSVTDNFFEIGGDSLSAVRLMSRVQRRFDVELPISALLEAPSVRDLACAIDNYDPLAISKALVPLSAASKSDAPPLFCVHPIGGHVLCYTTLARRLGAKQPFYGLQAFGLDGKRAPHTSVEQMAAAYIAEICARQPSGPVHVSGWSFGGMIAFEIAQQLVRSGRSVGSLVVMDTIASVKWRVEPSEDDLLECVAMELFGVGGDDADVRELLESGPVVGHEQRFDRLLAAARERGLIPAGASSAQLQHIFAVIRANILAGYDYQPKPYPGEVVLMRATERMPARLKHMHDRVGSAYDDPHNGWKPYCRSLRVIPVHADHLSIVFEPHVSAVSACLRDLLIAEPVRKSAATSVARR